MKQSLALMAVATLICGCQGYGQRPANDPFVGQMRVPPPGTGAASGRSTDPYYRGAPRVMAPLKSISSATPDTQTPNTQTPSATSVAGRERIVRVIQPRQATPDPEHVGDLAAASSAGQPRRFRPPERAIDIMDLPEASKASGSSASASGSSASASGEGGFRLVSGSEPEDSSAAVDSDPRPVDSSETPGASTGTSTGAAYGHDADYRWLRGKLEYSQIDRCWKLRYIPVDSATDKFGGSVVLDDPSKLSGLERGDFVEVQGSVGSAAEKGVYAPTYDVAKIRRLGTN